MLTLLCGATHGKPQLCLLVLILDQRDIESQLKRQSIRRGEGACWYFCLSFTVGDNSSVNVFILSLD